MPELKKINNKDEALKFIQEVKNFQEKHNHCWDIGYYEGHGHYSDFPWMSKYISDLDACFGFSYPNDGYLKENPVVLCIEDELLLDEDVQNAIIDIGAWPPCWSDRTDIMYNDPNDPLPIDALLERVHWKHTPWQNKISETKPALNFIDMCSYLYHDHNKLNWRAWCAAINAYVSYDEACTIEKKMPDGTIETYIDDNGAIQKNPITMCLDDALLDNKKVIIQLITKQIPPETSKMSDKTKKDKDILTTLRELAKSTHPENTQVIERSNDFDELFDFAFAS